MKLNEKNQFVEYSIKHGVSLVEAFNDRDEPMDRMRLAKEWKDATGEDLTEEQLEEIL